MYLHINFDKKMTGVPFGIFLQTHQVTIVGIDNIPFRLEGTLDWPLHKIRHQGLPPSLQIVISPEGKKNNPSKIFVYLICIFANLFPYTGVPQSETFTYKISNCKANHYGHKAFWCLRQGWTLEAVQTIPCVAFITFYN
jgi:hypothetical protein